MSTLPLRGRDIPIKSIPSFSDMQMRAATGRHCHITSLKGHTHTHTHTHIYIYIYIYIYIFDHKEAKTNMMRNKTTADDGRKIKWTKHK